MTIHLLPLLPSCLRERPLPGNFDFEMGLDLWLLLDEDLDLVASGFFAKTAGLVERDNKKKDDVNQYD